MPLTSLLTNGPKGEYAQLARNTWHVDHSPARAAGRLAHVAVVSAKIQKDCGAMLHLSSTVNKAQHVSFFSRKTNILSEAPTVLRKTHFHGHSLHFRGKTHKIMKKPENPHIFTETRNFALKTTRHFCGFSTSLPKMCPPKPGETRGNPGKPGEIHRKRQKNQEKSTKNHRNHRKTRAKTPKNGKNVQNRRKRQKNKKTQEKRQKRSKTAKTQQKWQKRGKNAANMEKMRATSLPYLLCIKCTLNCIKVTLMCITFTFKLH